MNQVRVRKWILKKYLKHEDWNVKYLDSDNYITVLDIFPKSEEHICEHAGIHIIPLSKLLWYINQRPQLSVKLHEMLINQR